MRIMMEQIISLGRFFTLMLFCLISSGVWGQSPFEESTMLFLMHSSGNHLEMGSDKNKWKAEKMKY